MLVSTFGIEIQNSSHAVVTLPITVHLQYNKLMHKCYNSLFSYYTFPLFILFEVFVDTEDTLIWNSYSQKPLGWTGMKKLKKKTCVNNLMSLISLNSNTNTLRKYWTYLILLCCHKNAIQSTDSSKLRNNIYIYIYIYRICSENQYIFI